MASRSGPEKVWSLACKRAPGATMNLAVPINLKALIEPVARRLFGEPNAALSSPGKELRWGSRGSLCVNCVNGTWFNHETNAGGGVIDLIRSETGRDQSANCIAWLRAEGLVTNGIAYKNPVAPSRAKPRIVATYNYNDELGASLFQVCRYEPKAFRQRRPGGRSGWIWNLDDTRRVLYRLPELIEAIAAEHSIFIAEGEKDVESLRALNIAATTNPGGVGKWRAEYNDHLRGADVVLIPDNDDAGREHMRNVASQLVGVAERLRLLELPGLPLKGDVSDWLAGGGTAEQLWGLVERAPEWQPADTPTATKLSRLQPLDLQEFFDLDIKQREMVLSPIIPEKGLVMLYAPRGTGKTLVAGGIAYSVATASQFLNWEAPKARRVLLVDGEMPAIALRERFEQIVGNKKPAFGFLKIISGDLIEDGGVSNLADPKVQAELDPHLEGIDLLILDNLSSLTAVIRDNDADSWNPIQAWILRLRRRGISVLIVHHAGKGGEQRGTSRREDILDTSISLRRPTDYIPTEGARFEVHIEKGRGIHGNDAKPFEAQTRGHQRRIDLDGAGHRGREPGSPSRAAG